MIITWLEGSENFMLPMMYVAMIDNQSDKEIFKKIVITYEKQFLLYANSILHNYSLSEEAVSESFFRLARNFQKVHNFEVSKIVAYTVIIIRNVCNNIISAEEKQKALAEMIITDEDTFDIDDEYEKYVARKVVEKLPEIYKDVIILRYYYGLSIDEIAQQIGLSYQGVRKRIATALKILRKETQNE